MTDDEACTVHACETDKSFKITAEMKEFFFNVPLHQHFDKLFWLCKTLFLTFNFNIVKMPGNLVDFKKWIKIIY